MKHESQSVEHLMIEERCFAPPKHFSDKALVRSTEDYNQMYDLSIKDSNFFWMQQAKSLEWFQDPTLAGQFFWNSSSKVIKHTWFEDGILNVTVNCLDRHIKNGLGSKTAIIWQGEAENDTLHITYQQLLDAVCRLANTMRSLGVQKGDRICIYLPMIPEAAIAMLACARIGAIHSVVFGGFSAESVVHRIQDATCKLVITANEGIRGGKKIALKKIIDEALPYCPSIEHVIVVKRTETEVPMESGRDHWYHEEVNRFPTTCDPTPLEAEHPLFILYTSGSTGKPKGVVHTQAGYLLYAAMTHKYIFDIKQEDIYWCTADVGWITGHSYVIYGPLANGATSLMFEGIPTYPDSGRFWSVIDQHRVTIFYTAPTVIRSLIQSGTEFPNRYKLDSLRLLGTVGEPINPEAWMWYYEVIGKGRCPIVDTWWQTETGGILLSALPGAHSLKPGSANKPFFGIEPVILNDDGTTCQVDDGGCLCIKKPWPGMMRTMWGNHDLFIDTYFSKFPDMYFTGDGCRKDPEDDYWLLGRIDDVVNVSGHRIGTAEVESALVSYEAVAEAAVVPIPDEIKGQGLYAFVTLISGIEPTDKIRSQILLHVRSEIGAIAVPQKIHFTNALPKTRSGKIMRRLLKKIATNDITNLGDISTLADPSVMEKLAKEAADEN